MTPGRQQAGYLMAEWRQWKSVVMDISCESLVCEIYFKKPQQIKLNEPATHNNV